jgi:hypothetical protein
MKKLLFISSLLWLTSSSIAQDGLGYYFDYNNHFYVFDKGNNIELESNRVDSVKVGDNYLAYIDQKSNLRVYCNGETQTIEESVPNAMIATANIFVYKMQQRLMVYQNGEKKQLASWAGNFFAGDSIVTWQAQPSLDIMAYQNGEIKTIEEATSTKVINGGKAGKNLFAYNDLNNNFKIYYNGQVNETGASNIRSYKCGQDVVAYIDRFNSSFNIYNKGDIKTITNQLPKNFAVTDNVVSYIDASGNFMAYYNGESTTIETYEPTTYLAKENVIIYYYEPELKIFYDGQVYTLEKFTQPKNVLLGINSALYLDNNNRAKYFYKGKVYDNFLIEQPKKIELNRDLPVVRYGNNSIGFFYNGKLYEYETHLN